MKKSLSKHKWKIIIASVVLALLGATFWYGGHAPGLQGWTVSEPTVSVSESEASPSDETPEDVQTPDVNASPSQSVASDLASSEPSEEPSEEPSPKESASPSAAPGSDLDHPMTPEEKLAMAEEIAGEGSSEGVEEGDTDYAAQQGMDIDPNTGKDQYLTDPVPEGKPVPIEPKNADITDNAMTCTLSVRCDTILDNIDWLDPEKVELVPLDGVIFPATAVTFYEGESVFNVLLREIKKAGIHMEFVNVPMYNSAYIEGINNLYEFDCGELSGWMYKVGGWFPNYGCSRYQLNDGDTVEWVYTCNLGVDVGGYYAVGS